MLLATQNEQDTIKEMKVSFILALIAVIFTSTQTAALAKKAQIADYASIYWGQATLSPDEAEKSDIKIKSALESNGFQVSKMPEGIIPNFPGQGQSGKRLVTWYSYSPNLKAAVISEALYSGFSIFVIPSHPTSLNKIWNPYLDLINKVKEQAR